MKNADGYTFEEWIEATRCFCLELLTLAAKEELRQEWMDNKPPVWGNR